MILLYIETKHYLSHNCDCFILGESSFLVDLILKVHSIAVFHEDDSKRLILIDIVAFHEVGRLADHHQFSLAFAESPSDLLHLIGFLSFDLVEVEYFCSHLHLCFCISAKKDSAVLPFIDFLCNVVFSYFAFCYVFLLFEVFGVL